MPAWATAPLMAGDAVGKNGYEAQSSLVIGKLETIMSSTMLINRSTHRASPGTNKIRVFIATLIVAGALPGCAVSPQSSNSSADQKITADVQASFRQHSELAAPDQIDVKTVNGVVYLNGSVSAGTQREFAESVAKQTPGVTRVIDSINVTH